MSNQLVKTWGIGVLGAAAVGAAAWYLMRQNQGSDISGKLGDAADSAREKAGGIARTLREKATPVMQTIGELVEKNAEVVSAIANLNADQVRKTGQEIRQAAVTLDKNLEALSNI